MTSFRKDSEEVVTFMVLFARLKTFVDDDPTDLVSDAIRDQSIRDLCAKLDWAHYVLKESELKYPELLSAPVDPDFIVAWRDFEKRYADAVGWISGSMVLSSLGLADDPEDVVAELAGERPSRLTEAEIWRSYDVSALSVLEKMKNLIDFVVSEVEADVWEDRDDQLQELTDGLAAWRHLTDAVGLDLQGILRRRAMVPFVLVPRKISNKQGSKERTSLMRNLKEAQDAFLFGSLGACVAMLRATLEVTLKEHYKCLGKDLSERINLARNLPPGASQRKLHEIRELANSLLHDPQGWKDDPVQADVQMKETHVAGLLVTVRALIEGVK